MSQNYELTGRVKEVGEPRVFGSGFAKAELVVTVDGDSKYPQDICLEFCQDKVSLLDAVSEGDEVTVHFNLRGREYNSRYFNSLQGWKIDRPNKRDPITPTPGKPVNEPDDYEDKIPF